MYHLLQSQRTDTSLQDVLGGTADTVGKGLGAVTNTAGNAGKYIFRIKFSITAPSCLLPRVSPQISSQRCLKVSYPHLFHTLPIHRSFIPVSDEPTTVGGLGNVLGDTLKGTTGTLGDATKGVGNVAKDTTGGVGDTARSATGAKQDAQNPLGLSE